LPKKKLVYSILEEHPNKFGIMKRFHSIRDFIRCIDKLKTPYPEHGLKKFLKSYIKSFTRECDSSHIYFNGEVVEVERTPGNVMSNYDIETMLLGLLKYHKKGGSIHKQFLKAIEELSKEPYPNVIEIDTNEFEQAFRDAIGDGEAPLADEEPIEVPPESSKPDGYPFERVVLREPTMGYRYRWEIGISGAPGSLVKIKNFVNELPKSFPEIYMLKFLKKESPGSESCSKSEIYLETEELNIQKILDRLHDLLGTSLSKKIMPKDCSKKPRFMANIPGVTGKDGTCIFTFSQGGEDVYEYKEALAAAGDYALNVLFDGDSYYKFFGTIDVGIDIDGYNTQIYLVDESAKMMKDIDDIDPELMGGFLKDPPVEFTEVGKSYFTQLLYTNSTSVKSFRDFVYGDRPYQNVTFLHGIDSTHPIVFIMKPGFERRYAHSILPGLAKSAKSPTAKSLADTKKAEASTFSFRFPKKADRGDKCSRNQTWCNTGLKVEGAVSFYDVDVVLVPAYLKEEFSQINENLYIGQAPNPLNYRVIFYGLNVPKAKFVIRGDEAFEKGLSRVPDGKYYLSYKAFVDAQKEYMFRLAYHGLYKDATHKFK
jgi:hypothetical protein